MYLHGIVPWGLAFVVPSTRGGSAETLFDRAAAMCTQTNECPDQRLLEAIQVCALQTGEMLIIPDWLLKELGELLKACNLPISALSAPNASKWLADWYFMQFIRQALARDSHSLTNDEREALSMWARAVRRRQYQ